MKKNLQTIIIWTLIMIICLPVLRVSADNEPSDTEDAVYRLPVFETSDIHGYLADTSTSHYEYRLAYISDKVRDRRMESGSYRKDMAVLLDGGDIFQGNTMSNFLKGHSLSAAFMRMDYDAVALGNHEFDWDVTTVIDPDGTLLDSNLYGTTEVNDIPVLTSNLYYKREKVTFAQEYIILEKTAVDQNGNELPVRIGVIGFTDDHSGSIMETRFSAAGYAVIVDYQRANRIVRELEESGQCDATILLNHGAAGDTAYNLGEGTVIDLVLGGHTHVNEAGSTSWGVAYMQPASAAAAYAEAEMTFKKEDGKAAFQNISYVTTISTIANLSKLYPGPDTVDELDPSVVELTDKVIKEISELLEARIGYIETPARKSDFIAGSGQRATTMGNWMASIIARACGAEVGFVNNGGIRTDIVMTKENPWRRTITASDIYTMFPFNNRLYTYEISYEELLSLLRYSLTDSGSTLLSRMWGIECHYAGQEVQAIVRDGKAVYKDGVWAPGWAERKIRVGASEFVATTNRQSGGMSNPLVAWNQSARLIDKGLTDAEGAFKALDEESLANNWALTVDTKPYYMNEAFRGPMWEEGGEPSIAPTDSPSVSPSGSPAEPTEREPFPDGPGKPPVWIVILIVLGALLLAAGITVLVIVLVKRKKKVSRPSSANAPLPPENRSGQSEAGEDQDV